MDLSAKTWASLADGTPLITSAKQGNGRIILVHVTANADWSNLPLTGTYAEMMQRFLALAPAAGSLGAQGAATLTEGDFAPRLLMTGTGELVSPLAQVQAHPGQRHGLRHCDRANTCGPLFSWRCQCCNQSEDCSAGPCDHCPQTLAPSRSHLPQPSPMRGRSSFWPPCCSCWIVWLHWLSAGTSRAGPQPRPPFWPWRFCLCRSPTRPCRNQRSRSHAGHAGNPSRLCQNRQCRSGSGK